MNRQLHRGSILHFLADPAQSESPAEYFEKGELLIEDGHVVELRAQGGITDTSAELFDHGDALLVPGFVDTHIHYPQVDIMAAPGEQLLEWLERYVFPAEAKFSELEHGEVIAEHFCEQLLSHGTTTALVFGTVHPESVDAFFGVAQRLKLRMIAGKVLMDRNAPEYLRDSADSGYEDSKALIERWHNKGRLRYAVTPRFAPTSTPEQLRRAGELLREFPDVYMHTHIAENTSELAWVAELFPDHDNYLHTYDDNGLLGRRSVFAHCIHLSDKEWERMSETHSNVAFCPSSNLFLGSGLFPLAKAREFGVETGLGTDIGAGTSFSLLETMADAYKTQQLQGVSLNALESFYLATLGGARALDLEDKIGNFEAGKEADFLVLDRASTPLLQRRLSMCSNLDESLFVLATLGDDRVIQETWILGELRHSRPNPVSGPSTSCSSASYTVKRHGFADQSNL